MGSRGSSPIVTDSADPHRPTDFTDTDQSALWATPDVKSELWAEPAPLPSYFLTPPPKILGHRPPPSPDESIHETLRLNPIGPFFSISLTVSDLSKMNVMFYYGI